MPLRAGLGLITIKTLQDYNLERAKTKPANEKPFLTLTPKFYTTRTHKLDGEYQVVEGSRFKAKPVYPRIEFRVDMSCRLDLRNALVTTDTEKYGEVWAMLPILSRDDLTFPELDLGIKGRSFSDLRDELLRLNKKATIDTSFYVSKLAPI